MAANINIVLTPAEQRKVIEHITGEPCIRIELSQHEFELTPEKARDFTWGQLKDGRWTCWRKRSLWQALKRLNGPLYRDIERRTLTDDVT